MTGTFAIVAGWVVAGRWIDDVYVYLLVLATGELLLLAGWAGGVRLIANRRFAGAVRCQTLKKRS